MNKIVNIFGELKQAVNRNNAKEDEDKVIVIDAYNQYITEKLIAQEHKRMENIHNLDEYLSLRERNDEHWNVELQPYLRSKYGQSFQKEVVKEIALMVLMKKYTLDEIAQMINKHEHPPKQRRFGE